MNMAFRPLKVTVAALSINSLPITPLDAAEIKRPETQVSVSGAKLAAESLKIIRTLKPFKEMSRMRPEGVCGNSLLVSLNTEVVPKGRQRKLASINRISGAVEWSNVFNLPAGKDIEGFMDICAVSSNMIGLGSYVYSSASREGSYFYRILNNKNGEEIASGRLADFRGDVGFMHLSGHEGKLLILSSAGMFKVDPKLKAPESLATPPTDLGRNLSLISEGRFFYLSYKSATQAFGSPRTWFLNGLSSVSGSKPVGYEIGTGIWAQNLFTEGNQNFTIVLNTNPSNPKQTSVLKFDVKEKKIIETMSFDTDIKLGFSTHVSQTPTPIIGMKLGTDKADSKQLVALDPKIKMQPLSYGDDCNLLTIDSSCTVTAARSAANPGELKLRLYALRDNQIFEDDEKVVKTSLGASEFTYYVSAGKKIYFNTGKGEITELEIVPGVSKALSSKN